MSYYIDVQKLIDAEKRQAVKKVLELLFCESTRTRITDLSKVTPTYLLYEEQIVDCARKYNLRFDEGYCTEVEDEGTR